MGKHVVACIVGVLAIMALPLQAAQPDRSSSGPYVFIGFSSGTTKGGAGYPGMNALCQDDFGDDARMATTLEYIVSPDASAPGATTAWIDPVGSTGSTTCNGDWRSSVLGQASGLIIESAGSLGRTADCGIPRLVACSAPSP